MNNFKSFAFFGALVAFFIILDMAGCATAKADDLDLNVIEAEFWDSEMSYELEQLDQQNLVEAFEPDNREPSHYVPVPEVFKDSDIKRKLKDGTVQAFDGDKYMIVPRTHTHKKPKKVVKCQPQIIEKEVVRKEPTKRAITVLVGHGPTDRLNVQRNNNGSASVRNSNGVVGTLQYKQRFHKDGWHWAGQLQTNETYSLGIGKDF